MAPSCHKSHWKRWGAKPHTFSSGLCGKRGPSRPPKSAIPAPGRSTGDKDKSWSSHENPGNLRPLKKPASGPAKSKTLPPRPRPYHNSTEERVQIKDPARTHPRMLCLLAVLIGDFTLDQSFGRFLGSFPAKLGPKTPLNRSGSKTGLERTGNQPRKPILIPFRDHCLFDHQN